MKIVKATCLTVLILTVALLISTGDNLMAQGKVKCLTVKHEIITTGLPLVGPVVVFNTQEIMGNRSNKSTRASRITMGDSVLSDVAVMTITDLVNNKQLYVNPKTNICAEKFFNSSEFPVIDSIEDSERPQMAIKKTGKTKTIDGKKCSEIHFKLDMSSSTGVGDAKIKHYFEGTMWVTQEITNWELYSEYNTYAHNYFRGTRYSAGGFFDILAKLDVDQYNLIRLIKAMDGIPVEATFVAQLPSSAGGHVFETKIKLVESSNNQFDKGHFELPKEGYKVVPVTEFRSF
jgi:hypothetical protein